MGHSLRSWGDMRRWMAIGLLAMTASACGDSKPASTSGPVNLRLETTRLCALVPARDPAAAAFPPTPPVRVFGTDLGWTYERDGVVTILFGDTWQRIDICPLQLNDDSLATMSVPANDWPGYHRARLDARRRMSGADLSRSTRPAPRSRRSSCAAGTASSCRSGRSTRRSPASSTASASGASSSSAAVSRARADEAASGAPCPDRLSRAQAADLVCGRVGDAAALPRSDQHASRRGRAGALSARRRARRADVVRLARHVPHQQVPEPHRPRRARVRSGRRAPARLPARHRRAADVGPARVRRPEPRRRSAALLHVPPAAVRGARRPDRLRAALPERRRGRRAGVRRESGRRDAALHRRVRAGESRGGQLHRAARALAHDLRRQLDRLRQPRRQRRPDRNPFPARMYARFAPEPWGPWTDPDARSHQRAGGAGHGLRQAGAGRDACRRPTRSSDRAASKPSIRWVAAISTARTSSTS